MEIEETNETEIINLDNILREIENFQNSQSQENSYQIETRKNEQLTYLNQSSKYIYPKTKNFSVQYASFYFMRLSLLRPIFSDNLKRNYDGPVCKIIEIDSQEECAVIGSISKEMKNKITVLMRIASGITQSEYKNYCNEDDVIYIEDETGKMKLDFSNKQYQLLGNQRRKFINQHSLFSGMVISVVGNFDQTRFKVKSVCLGGLPEQSFTVECQLSKDISSERNQFNLNHYYEHPGQFMLLISNIDLLNNLKSFYFFKQLILGNSSSKFKEISKQIQRIIVVGNLFDSKNYQEDQDFNNLKEQINIVDLEFADLSQNIAVDIMPGSNDIKHEMFPLQPYSKFFFKNSYQYKNLQGVTNPYAFQLEKQNIIGTSGENVQDILQHSLDNGNELDVMEMTIQLNHLFPTTPETLKSYPYFDQDPFIIEELPQIYFCGNSDQFQTKIIEDIEQKKMCRLISVPKFRETNSFVIVNLKNFDTFQIFLNALL